VFFLGHPVRPTWVDASDRRPGVRALCVHIAEFGTELMSPDFKLPVGRARVGNYGRAQASPPAAIRTIDNERATGRTGPHGEVLATEDSPERGVRRIVREPTRGRSSAIPSNLRQSHGGLRAESRSSVTKRCPAASQPLTTSFARADTMGPCDCGVSRRMVRVCLRK
jgi:hypothetical protein